MDAAWVFGEVPEFVGVVGSGGKIARRLCQETADVLLRCTGKDGEHGVEEMHPMCIVCN